MPSSVLGKRTRSSTKAIGSIIVPDRIVYIANSKHPDAESSVLTRAKRQAQLVIQNDENENPFVTCKARKTARTSSSSSSSSDEGRDELAEDIAPSPKHRPPTTTPAKHGNSESRVSLPSSKINAHFKVTKAPSVVETKQIEATTPRTPRHRDALSKKVPVTPRHRVALIGKPLTPRSPRTPNTPRSLAPTIYNEARQTFTRSVHPGRLVGRDNERKELSQFISQRVQSHCGGCIYVSGPPGTGKSALVNEVCDEFAGTESLKAAYVNCMSVRTAEDIYTKLLDDITGDADRARKDEMKTLQAMFGEEGTLYLVSLDEIDHLLDVDLELLYNLFEWALKPCSSLLLVGIANALDFTDRFLPRLKARGLKPQLLPFMPNSAAQITSVITAKLKALLPPQSSTTGDFVPFLHPTAILFLSKKVAAQSGDLRKAFDICRRAIDLIESEVQGRHTKAVAELTPAPSPSKTPLVENMNLSSPPACRTPSGSMGPFSSVVGLSHLTIETAPRATIAHMARITASVFGNGITQRLQTLNLQQKAVLCALTALEKKRREASAVIIFSTPSKTDKTAPTVKVLFEAYSSLCKRENVLHPLTNTEFRDVIGSLETFSLIAPVEGKSGSLAAPATPSKRGRGGFGSSVLEERRVASCIGVKELASALDGTGSVVLRGILEGDGLV